MEREAATLRIGLQLGLVSVQDIVRWADEQITATATPPEALLDLALMAHATRLDVLAKLRALSPRVPWLDVLPRTLGTGVHRLREDPSLGPIVARGLYQLFVEANYEVPDELSPIGRFDDGYALAKQGSYGTEEGVFQELVAFASRFEDAR
jgi:hypothetical protein